MQKNIQPTGGNFQNSIKCDLGIDKRDKKLTFNLYSFGESNQPIFRRLIRLRIFLTFMCSFKVGTSQHWAWTFFLEMWSLLCPGAHTSPTKGGEVWLTGFGHNLQSQCHYLNNVWLMPISLEKVRWSFQLGSNKSLHKRAIKSAKKGKNAELYF